MSIQALPGCFTDGSSLRIAERARRKFFKTQMLALRAQPDYVDYMMGHTVDTYHDIQMKGIEYLRNIYAASGLSIRPKTKATKMETLKDMIRALGYDPEKILMKEAFVEPHRTVIVNSIDRENDQIEILTKTLKDLFHTEKAS